MRLRITDLMSRNADVFLDLIVSQEFNMSTSSWDSLIQHFRTSEDPEMVRIAAEVPDTTINFLNRF